ncbi:MAG: hypothetical protein M3247_02955 [Thermoproteota archaeon]|nr:hypothetical protein [Thermoproteota archaeon]
MNQQQTLAILTVMIAATAALAVAPSLVNLSFARQTATITCDQTASGDSSGGSCPGSSVKSPNKEETCTAKNNGQTAKLCP